MPLTQEERLIRMMKGPLGADEIHLTSFAGQEAMSRLFNFQIEFVSTKMDLKPGEIVGKDLTIEIDRADEDGNVLDPRFFHGYINRVFAGDVTVAETGVYKHRNYRAEIVPWLWFLTQTSRCFIFFPEKEDKSIYEIIEAVFDRAKSDLHIDPIVDLAGISDLKSRMVKHCVQYRETDFNFVSRIMEQYGAFYYFKHEDGKHTMVVDMKKNYPTCEESEVPFPSDTGTQIQQDHITSWQHNYEFVSGKYEHTDYNFTTPLTDLKTNAPKLPSIDLQQNEKYEVYDYPGEYASKPDGKSDAGVRQEEEEVSHNVVHATSLCKTFSPGYKFKLIEHPNEEVVTEQDNSYLITSIHHSASQPGPDGDEGFASAYSNSFTCIPDSVQYRPARITPKPLVSGVQTGVVVGSGEPIFTDKYGRVKVHFFWSRESKQDENSCCWVRVSQTWAGKGWGAIHIPHPGHEVIIDFEEGDPDRPLVVGRLYNEDHKVPLPLPDNKTVSGFVDQVGNKMFFESKEGEEQIFIRTPNGESSLIIGAGAPGPAGKTGATGPKGDAGVPASPEGIRMLTQQNMILQAQLDRLETTVGNLTRQTDGDVVDTTLGGVARYIVGDEFKQTDGKLEWKLGGTLNSITMGASTSQNLSAKSTTTVGIEHGTFVGVKMAINLSLSTDRTYGVKYSFHGATEKHDTSGPKWQTIGSSYTLKAPKIFSDAAASLVTKGGGSTVAQTSGAIKLTSGGSSITLAKGGVVTIKCSSVKFKCSSVDFGGAKLKNAKDGKLF